MTSNDAGPESNNNHFVLRMFALLTRTQHLLQKANCNVKNETVSNSIK